MIRTPHRATVASVLMLAVLFVFAAGPVLAQDTYQRPPEDLAKLVDAPATPGVSLSPDQQHMLLMHPPSLSSIAELAEPELRLAGIRINPRNNGPSRARPYVKLGFKTLDGSAERPVTGLPDPARIRNVRWAPDGQHIAFTVDQTDRIDLYVADVATARARRVMEAPVNNAFWGAPYEWVSDSRTLIVRAIPGGRGAAPEKPLAPAGPIIQENLGEKAPARTYQDLLKNPHDEAVFAHYMATQVMRVPLDGEAVPLGEPGLVTYAAPSPNGQYVLVEATHKPFSYLVPAYRFPNRIRVLDLDGNLVKEIADVPLKEGVPTAFGSVPTGIRSIDWRADTPASLYWAEALDGGDARAEADYRDQIYMLEAPFDGTPTALVKLPLRYGGITWGDEGLALVNESWWSTRKRRVYVVDPSRPGAEPRVLFDVSFEDRYNNPGSPMRHRNAQGKSVLRMADGGKSIYMTGAGASPEGNRPFLRKLDLATGETEELFRSQAPYYERPITLVDDGGVKLMTLRETNTEPPNFFLRALGSDDPMAVTNFPHPYPELAAIHKESIQYKRDDGVPLSATLYLPAGYDAERDGPLPAFVWAYPREFKSADAAGQRSDSPHQFKRVSYWGAVPYVTQGYAVIDNASMPIIGEGEQEPNDTFREQLVLNAKGAIDEGVRRGVVDPERVAIGGHSYGAFMTANLLAHSDLFRAGIARSGAYNRTLTPFGFQAEERLFWEAPEIYYYMSPFMHVDKVNEPILLIHGEADNNSGTFPLQSRRYYNALKGLGKTARLVMLPHESHGYRARESIMHMLWETNRWLETYVKDAPPREEMKVEGPTGDRR